MNTAIKSIRVGCLFLVMFSCSKTEPVPASKNAERTSAQHSRTKSQSQHRDDYPTVDSVLTATRKALAKLKSYRIRTRFVFKDHSRPGNTRQLSSKGEAEISTLLPNKMSIRLRMSGQINLNITYDGLNLWVETAHIGSAAMHSGNTFVTKLDQQKLALKDHPFDLGYGIAGHGLAAGTDYVGTFHEMIQMYDFTAVKKTSMDGNACWELEGTLDPEATVAYLMTKQIPNAFSVTDFHEAEAVYIRSIKHFRTWLNTVRITIDQNDHLPRAWAFGPKADDANITVLVNVFDIQPNATIPAKVFEISSQLRRKAKDITQHILKKQRVEQQARADKKAVAALKERILHELKN